LNKNRFSLNAKFEDIKDHNSTILVTKMKVFALGKNLNLSSISESSFNKARDSIFNIPVVAKFTEDEDKYGKDGDLEGHNVKLKTDKNGNLTIEADTAPIGVIGSDANITYEEVNEGTDDEPDFKTYVCVDKVYLWKRYDAVQKIQEWLNEGIEPKVSMEIGEITGSYSKEQGCYVINSFQFEAVAALGSEITPCFPRAEIESYSKQTFEESFYSMLKELKFSLQSDVVEVAEELEEGGTNLKKVIEIQESVEILEAVFEAEVTLETVEEIEVPANFALTSEQLEDELCRELCEIETISEDWYGEIYTSPRFYYIDNKIDQNIVIAWDSTNNYLVGGSFSTNADSVEVDALSLVRYKVDYIAMDLSGDTDNDEMDLFSIFTSKAKSEFMLSAKEKSLTKQFEIDKASATADITNQLTELQEKYSALEAKYALTDSELATKLQAEREASEDTIFESFSKSLTEEEMADVKLSKADFSLQEIEDKLCVILGRKSKVAPIANFSKVEEAAKPLRYSIIDTPATKVVSEKSYADIIVRKEVE